MTKSHLHGYYRKLTERQDEDLQGGKEPVNTKKLVGINIKPNIETEEFTPYLLESELDQCAREVLEYGDYLVLNLAGSSNDRRQLLLNEKKLRSLIKAVQKTRTLTTGYHAAFDFEQKNVLKDRVVEPSALENNTFHAVYNHYDRNSPIAQRKTPMIFIKTDATLTKAENQSIARIALEEGLDGMVVGSSSQEVKSSSNSKSVNRTENVGGKPNQNSSLAALRDIYQVTQGNNYLER